MQVVHEAEVQRQHIRISLPVRVEINGEFYTAADWSHGGVGLEIAEEGGDTSHFTKGMMLEAALHFPFEGFSITIPAKLEVIYANSGRRRIGCRFEDLDRQRQSLLHYFVTASIGGEIIRMQEVMEIVARNNFTRSRNIPEAPKKDITQRLRMASLAVIGLLLLGYIGLSLYERLFILQATSARVTAELLTADAPAGGKVYYQPLMPDSRVEKGQPLLTIATAKGNVLSVDSPCDCTIKRRLAENNRLARKGEPLLELAPLNTQPWVEAYLPQKHAVQLATGQEALLTLPGYRKIWRGTIASIQAGKGFSGNALIRIISKKPLPVEAVDDPVALRIDTLGWL